jgi:hypothetical protein
MHTNVQTDIHMTFFSRFGSLAFLAFSTLFSSQTYQIKYEPVTRQCDFFVNLEYVAHFSLKTDDPGCLFILPYPVTRCHDIQSKNSLRSEIGPSRIILEPKERNAVAFNGYVCD